MLLLGAELVTLTLTLTMLGGATRYWLRAQARSLAEMLPAMVSQLDISEIEQIGPNDTPATNPAYRSVVNRLQTLYLANLPETGHQMSIVVVAGDKEAKIAAPEDNDDQKSIVGWFEVEPYALEAIQSRASSYSPYPYTTSNGMENITAYAPILDKSGQVRFLLSIDRDTSSLADILRMVRYSFLLAVLPAILVSVALASFLSSRFVNALDFLRTIHELTAERTAPLPTSIPEPAFATAAAHALNAPSPTAEQEPNQRPPTASPLGYPPAEAAPPVPASIGDPIDTAWASLTERERETATLSFLKYKEIAERMGISVEGVKKHSQNARAKLGVRDRVEMALYAMRMGALRQAPPSDRPRGDVPP